MGKTRKKVLSTLEGTEFSLTKNGAGFLIHPQVGRATEAIKFLDVGWTELSF